MTYVPTALEADIMDGHNRSDASEEGVSLENGVWINRNKGGLPVMGVDDIRSEAYEG